MKKWELDNFVSKTFAMKDHKQLRSIAEEGKGKLQWERSDFSVDIVI